MVLFFFKTKKTLLSHMRNNHRKKEETIYEAMESDIDELELDQTAMAELAQELDLKEATEELQLISSMKSTMHFDTSVLIPNAEETEESPKVINVLSNSGQPMVGEFIGKNQVPMCAPAAKVFTESQKKLLIPDPPESDDDDCQDNELLPPTNSICGECGETFSTEEEGTKHMISAHGEKISETTNHSAGDHKCQDCNYRTNLALHFIQHGLNHHTSEQLTRKLNDMKPVDPPVVYILAEQNMALVEETKSLRKELNYIKKALRPKAPSTKFHCQKCNVLSSSPTRIQEHILEDHCCKYCEKTFSSKIEKERHKKYLCTVCEKTFSHNIEFHIHNKTYHKPDNTNHIQNNQQKKSQVKQFKCTECEYQQENEESLIKHIEYKHASILSPAKVKRPVPAPRNFVNNQLECPICSYTSTSETDITKHFEEKHVHKCNTCKKEFSSIAELVSHTSKEHETIPSNTHKCDKCSHTFSNKSYLKKHMTEVHEGKKLQM